MNKKHVQAAITVMRRAQTRRRKFNMLLWRDTSTFQHGICRTETMAEGCGMTCCFGGWLAISPEWVRAGGTVSETGVPVFDCYRGAPAIAAFLDIPDTQARLLAGLNLNGQFSPLYQLPVSQIEPGDVIHQLKVLYWSNFTGALS